MADVCIWTGASGKKYEYTIYLIETNWNDVPGNYIFAKKTAEHEWEVVYIGETESFKNRIPNHEKLPCVKRNGGTHVHAHVNQGSQARLDEESDLCRNHTTTCND